MLWFLVVALLCAISLYLILGKRRRTQLWRRLSHLYRSDN